MISIILGEVFLASLAVFNTTKINDINYIETIEPTYTKIPVPVDQNLGAGVLTSYSKIVEQTVGTSKVRSSYTQTLLYKYPKTISAPIEAYGEYMSMTGGSSVLLSFETTISKTKSYSKQVSDTMKGSLGATIKLESGIGILKEETSLTSTLEFGETLTDSISDAYSNSVSKKMEMTFNIDETGTYHLQRRGMFEVYIVEYITAVYDVKSVNGKLYSGDIAYYTAETKYVLSYINSSSTIGLYKYNWNDINHNYELDKDYARKFLNSNTVNSIE